MSWLNHGKEKLFILLLIVLSIPAILPLLQPGFFLSDDGEWMIIRFSAFHQAFSDGQFPVRMLSRLNHEYGYPVANFLYPGFMYLAEVPKILGFGFVNSIKIVLGLSMVMSAVFSYLWLTKLFGRFAAFIGALFYLYAPYHLYDLYKRGSVGEILALAVVPFIFWQIERKSFFWIAIGISAFVLSHNTLALLFFPVILFYSLVRYQTTIRYLLYAICSGLSLSAFFWIPAIFDLQYTKFSQTQVSNWQDHFGDFSLIGIASIFIVIGALYLRFIERKKDNISAMFIVFSSLSAFMAYPGSAYFWQILPASFVQFPFRFLSITIFGVSFLVSWYVNEMKGKQKAIVSALFLTVLFLEFFNSPYRKPETFFDKGDSYYATNQDSTTVKNEYMPRWVKVMPTERASQSAEIIRGNGVVSNIVASAKEISFTVSMQNDGIVRTNKIYFPGWKARFDGEEIAILYENEKGVMDVAVSSGSHNISLTFGETPVRLFSDLISLGGLVGLLFVSKRKI